jgi:hypothetical protein
MTTLQRFLRFSIVRFYVSLLSLYPNLFRRTFSDEIQGIFRVLMTEAGDQGGAAIIKISIREFRSLVISIIKENWHELKPQKEKVMAPEDNLLDDPTSGGGGAASFEAVGMLGWKWIPVWTVLITVSIPVALILMAPFAALLLLLFNLGESTGILSSFNDDLLHLFGFCVSFPFTLATAQWLMLRNYLPNARTWFVATAGGVFIGGLIGLIGTTVFSNVDLFPEWGLVVMFLPIGIVLGLAQWFVLRQILSNAFWIIVIDVAANCSLLLFGGSISNLVEIVIVPLFPGLITGLGFWLLLKEPQSGSTRDTADITKGMGPRASRFTWIGYGLVALVPMFFLCTWLYATSQLALAKNEGVYASVEEAVIAKNSQGWGGAEVLSVEDVVAGPNRRDGSQPHVWFGGATVYLDRVPQGWDRQQFSSGSYFIRVEKGWVHVPEGALPVVIGWIMEFYGLEGLN